MRSLGGEGERDAAGTGTDVEHPGGGGEREGERYLHQQLRLRPRNEHTLVDDELPAEEFAPAPKVGHGLAGRPAREQHGVPGGIARLDGLLVPGADLHFGETENRAEEKSRLPPGRGDSARGERLAPGGDELSNLVHSAILWLGGAKQAGRRS